MTLQEKLDLLWKYLLLAVLVYGIAQVGSCNKCGMGNHPPGLSGHGMTWMSQDGCDSEDMDFDVDIKSFGEGDSTIQVIINGETVDIKDLERMGEHVYVKKITKPGDNAMIGKKNVKMIKKKVSTD